MSKQKDASTCDERQVKNKPNRLTYKRKGETRRMSSESMKHWKVSLFFVISLALMVGLFSNTAAAQSASIRVSPPSADSEAEVDVKVTYQVTTPIQDSNQVTIMLPAGWTSAQSDTGGTDDSFGSVVYINTAAAAITDATDSYLVVQTRFRFGSDATLPEDDTTAGQVAGDNVTVTAPTPTTDPVGRASVALTFEGTMGVGDAFDLTFHNVRVPKVAMDAEAQLSVTDSDNSDSAVYNSMAVINVNAPDPSMVEVMPDEVDSEDIADVEVTYTAQSSIMENVITISLPGGWTSAQPDTGGTANSFGTAVRTTLPTTGRNTTSYMVAKFTKTTGSDAALPVDGSDANLVNSGNFVITAPTPTTDPVGRASVRLTFTGTMKTGDKLVLTFHNARVPKVEEEREDQVTVTDDISADGAIYNDSAKITINPPTPSMVEVMPDDVDSDDIADVEVTYTAQSSIMGNVITIKLPTTGWAPAYVNTVGGTGTSFGTVARTTLPTTGRHTTSYVVAKFTKTTGSDAALTADGTDPELLTTNSGPITDLSGSDPAMVVLTFTGTMKTGDKLVLTFHNVKVPAVAEETEAQLTVTDSIDADGSEYMADATITINPPTPSMVDVMPDDVDSGAIEDVIVTYTAQSPIPSNVVVITLPEDWGPANGDFDIATTAPSDTTESYVLVETPETDSAAATGTPTIFDASGNAEVTVPVTGTMGADDTFTVTFYNVQVPMVQEQTETQLTVKDNLSTDGSIYNDSTGITINPPMASTVAVSPDAVDSDDIADVTVTYEANTAIVDNQVVITLPDDWAPANGDFDVATATPTDATESYVMVDDDLETGSTAVLGDATISNESGNAAVTVPFTGTMGDGDEVSVVFHNVRVPMVGMATEAQFTVTDSIDSDGSNYMADATITINPPDASTVAVSPDEVDSDDIDDVTVTYTANSPILNNEVVITLPTGWGPANGDFDVAAATPTDATESYVMVTTDLETGSTAVLGTATISDASGNAEVTVPFTGTMDDGDAVSVIFYNVRVPMVADETEAQFTVMDSIDADYDASATITINPPMASEVAVSLDDVDSDDITDVTVTYTAKSPILENEVVITLPTGWGPANGDFDVATTTPTDTTESYVMVTTDLETGSMATLGTPTISDADSNAMVTVPFTGTMDDGDAVSVTFYNVKVPPVGTATDTQFMVTDSIDADGSNYMADAAITINPVDLAKWGNIRVTPTAATANSVVDLMVRYTATNTLADSTATTPSYGRIQITLPPGWGPNDEIHLERQVGEPNATYLNLVKSGDVALAATPLIVGGDQSNGWVIQIDVNTMKIRRYVTLTIKNLQIGALSTPRTDRYADITGAALMDKLQVNVLSNQDSSAFTTALDAITAHSPRSFTPKVTAANGGSDTQPTITVNRKTLGEVTVAPASVTAGSEQDFTITYKATEALAEGDVIEVKLPPRWPAPTPYNFNTDRQLAAADGTMLKDATGAHVHLSGSATRLEGAVINVTANAGGDIVQVVLGTRGVSKNGTIVLKYNDVIVQRHLATGDDKLIIETFSGPVTASSLPQFPVAKLAEDTIEVKHAADGSGKIVFRYEGENVTSMSGKDSEGIALISNTDRSIPAGIDKGDLRELIVTYMPEGDMGDGEFELRLPSDWKAEDVRVSGGEKFERSGNTVTVELGAYFGESGGDEVEVTLLDITVPNNHGEVSFTAKSSNARGSLKSLNPRPMAFVGNAEATHDTVAVTITPAAAYENWEDVDFEIEITNAGPLHDSEIRITVPEELFDLQTSKAAEANYVKLVSTSARSVRLSTLDIIDEDIVISTGKLNANGRIRVRFDNVDLSSISNISTADDDGFRVATRTRGGGPAVTDKDYASLDDVEYVDILKADGARSIAGGKIRTINGSGTMVVEPLVVEQNSRNETIKLTYTAATDFDKKNLVIQMPSVIETELQETNASGQGHVSTTTSRFHADIKAEDRLKISGSTITWTGVKLRRDQTFVTLVKRVDFLEYTGDFPWDTSLGGALLPEADNKPMVVVGTTAEDVAFEIVENGGTAVLAPSYPASSKQSIRFQFTAENTAIQPGGRLRFTVPGRWTMPSLTDRAGRATVSIVSEDSDGNEILVSEVPKTGEANAGSKMVLSVSGRSVTVTIGAKGGLSRGQSVTIQYGTTDLKKFPVQIPSSVAGTAGNDADGLAIHGSYRVSGETGFRQRSAGAVWIDVTNVEDGTGTVSVTPPSVRASSTDNLIRITYTAIGTMDGGAVHLIIPDDWGAVQDDDNTAANYVTVTVGTGAVLTSSEVLNSGRSVEANLKTLGEGDTVMFTYGGGVGANKGAAAQAEIGDATFIIESRGSSGGDFVPITDEDSLEALTIDVKGAVSGSGTVAVKTMKNKAGEEDGQINAGDDKTYLVFTYTAKQSIEEGELELTVPSGWTAPQQEDTNRPGYTYLEEGNALVSDEEYSGQSITATIAMDAGNVIKIHYGWYDAENGGAHAPSAAGTSVFEVKFDGAAVAMQPSVIVHGGVASKLMVSAPSTVSADPGADPATITVEIQDDTDTATVMASDLAVTLSSTSSTGSFTDADGGAIANNMITISAGMTGATVHYSDTTVGTATIRAMTAGLDSGRADIEVTTDIDTVDEDSISVSPATATAGDTVTVSADGTAGRTATFSVGTVVTDGSMTESPAGSYSGTFTVVANVHDGTHDVTVTIGGADPATVEDAITIDTTAPVISSASASPATVENGETVTISAMVTGATSVTADVSALDDTQTAAVTLSMANGSYSASVTISDDNGAANGSKTITVTAMDDAGNSAMSTAMVTLDNKLTYTSTIPAGQSLFHVPLHVEGLDTIGDLKEAIGSGVLNAIVYDSGAWNARADDMEITAGLGILLVMSEEASVTFEGQPWGGGTATLSLGVGSNLVGLGVNDSRVTNVSDIISLFPANTIASITVSTGDAAAPFAAITSAGATGDGPVMGDAAYLISVAGTSAPAPVALIGTGWSNGDAATAPIALAGYNVDGQTAVLDVSGAVVDEITGLASEGFRVKVKNLSTKASLTKVTSAEIAEGYNMTFVDLKVGNAARIGDVLEISADSPNPLVGVKPVRHVVTVDDVKNGLVILENLIAYEIPAETALLRNYPNPFNPETWIPYHLSEDADVSLTIYDVNGALVRTIDVGHQIAAKYDTRSKAVYWDGRNQFGEQVASGIYFYSLSAGDFSATRKMVILK